MDPPSKFLSRVLSSTRRVKVDNGEWWFAIIDFLHQAESFSGYNNASARWKSIAAQCKQLAAKSAVLPFSTGSIGHARKRHLTCGDAQLLHDIVAALPARQGRAGTRNELLAFFSTENTAARNAYLDSPPAAHHALAPTVATEDGSSSHSKRSLEDECDKEKSAKRTRVGDHDSDSASAKAGSSTALALRPTDSQVFVTYKDGVLTVPTDGTTASLERVLAVAATTMPGIQTLHVNHTVNAQTANQVVYASNTTTNAVTANQLVQARQMNMINYFARSHGPAHLVERQQTRYLAGNKRDASKAGQLLTMHSVKSSGPANITRETYKIFNCNFAQFLIGHTPAMLFKKLRLRTLSDNWRNYVLPSRLDMVLQALNDLDVAIADDEAATGRKLLEKEIYKACKLILVPLRDHLNADLETLKVDAFEYFFGTSPYRRNHLHISF
jgi:hypothetical protein